MIDPRNPTLDWDLIGWVVLEKMRLPKAALQDVLHRRRRAVPILGS